MAADTSAGDRYNLVVIGGGPAGLATATGAAALGARVALIEKGALGGESLHTGSVPSKALARAARTAAAVRWASDWGLTVHGKLEVDFPAVLERFERLRTQLSSRETTDSLRDKGIDLLAGEGRFADRTHVAVGEHVIPFQRAVIATGSSPLIPPLEGLSSVPFLTSGEVVSLRELPRRLAVIGAGPVGCELAQTFARFGSEVTVFEREPRCLNLEDPDAADIVRRSLERDGVTFHFHTAAIRFERDGDTVGVHAQSEGRWFVHSCDRVLVAAGRIAHTAGLHLEAAGVQYDESGIVVDALLRTTNPRVFACGDVCSQFRYTHAADALARMVIANSLFMAADRVDTLLVPRCTYTDPEIAHVGIGESEVAGTRLSTLRLPLADLDRAILDGCTDGLLKIHHDPHGTIRGATIVAPDAGELIGEIVLAMNHGVKLGALASDVHPYPTYSESFKRAGDHFHTKLLTPSALRLLKRYLAWRR